MTIKEREEILEGIYWGIFTKTNLPVNLYVDTASQLFRSVEKGFRKRITDLSIIDDQYNLLNQFRGNINIFSGAKTFQQIKDSQNFILNNKGTLRPFFDYMQDVKKIDALYNEDWLRVEKDMAVKRAQGARYWEDIEKDKNIMPLLQYRTVGDERVRAEHALLDGTIKPVNDLFWDSYMPPNGWSCRCQVIQLDEGKITPDSKLNYDKINEEVPMLFRNNPAKTGYIYKTEGYGVHPYIKVEKKYEVLKQNNFGLPMDF